MVNMSSLKHIGMNFVDVSMVGSRWFHVITSHSSLQILEIWQTYLSSFPPMPSFLNLIQLRYLDLSSSDFYGNISLDFEPLPHLEELYNRTTKGFLNQMGNIHNLHTLSSNDFEDFIASKVDWLCSLTNLTNLYILNAFLNSKQPSHPRPVVKFTRVSSSYRFGFLLFKLNISISDLVILAHNFLYGFKLKRKLTYLDLSQISGGYIPAWFENITSQLQSLNLSKNNISSSSPYITLPLIHIQ
ncbi:receptor-like protein 43 [Aristolochia californica]|uniref:receptor-like protein 43 n=1 Tax=Aristolochia californica TaxID=171875 RepID=UPI0035D67AA4